MLCQSEDRIKTTSESMSRATRLKHRDYSTPGLYFVTICAHFKRCIFSRVTRAGVELTPLGRIARESWVAIETHFVSVKLQPFVIMPNHLHGIIEIASAGLAQHAVPLQRSNR
jgi:REP element-mobilizing transposase RayT